MIFPRQATGKKLFFRLRLVAYSQSSKKAAASLQEVAAFFAKYPKNKMVRCKTLSHFLQSKLHHFSVFCCIYQLFLFYPLRIQHFKNNRLLTFNQQLSIIMTVRQRTSIIRQLSFFHRKGGNRMKHAEKEEKQPSFLKRHFNAIATVCIVLIPTIYTTLFLG